MLMILMVLVIGIWLITWGLFNLLVRFFLLAIPFGFFAYILLLVISALLN